MENEQLPIVKRLLDQIGDRDIVGYGSSVKKELIVDENYHIFLFLKQKGRKII